MDECQWRVDELAEGEEEEDAGGGLLGRSRSKRAVKGETFKADDGNEGDGVAEEKMEDEGHWRSVYFDQAEGKWKCLHCPWIYQVGSAGINHFETGYGSEVIDERMSSQLDQLNNLHLKGVMPSSEITAYKKSTSGETETNEMQSSLAPQSEIEKLMSLVSDSEAGYPIENMVEKSGLEDFYQDEPLQKNRWSYTETDVERVLEEQETHDLFCPNCNSCITKRVILRKRKRRTREILFDAKREKIESVQTNILPILDANGTPAEHPAQEPYIFRCLSCFSFFIPIAEGGFRLFKGFWRKDSVDENLQSSQPVPAKSPSGPSSFSQFTNEGENQGKGTLASARIKAQPQSPTSKKSDSIKDSEVISTVLEPPRAKIPYISEEPDDQIEGMTERKTPQVLEKSDDITDEKSEIGAEDCGQFNAENIAPEQRGHAGNGTFVSAKIKAEPGTPTSGKIVLIQGSEVIYSVMEPQRARISDISEELDDRIERMTEIKIPEILEKYDNRTDEKSEIIAEDYWEPMSENITPQQRRYPGEGTFVSGRIKDEAQTPTLKKEDSIKESKVVSPFLEPRRAKIPDVLEESEDQIEGKSEMRTPEILRKYDARADEKSEIITEDYVDAVAEKNSPEKMGHAGESVTIISDGVRKGVPQVAPLIEPQPDSQGSVHVVNISEENVREGSRAREWDVLKAIVYGGLVESITSLGVISAASGANTHSLNVTALGLANLIGGLILIFHNLLELRNEEYEDIDPQYECATCYGKSLGKREHFRLHAAVALISYIVFGTLPIIIYGFSFRKSDNKEYKLIVVAVGSLICIALLALAKAHVQREPKPYLKYLFSYIVLGFSVSGLAYVAGIFIEKFFKGLATFGNDNSLNSPIPLMGYVELNSKNTGWSSY